MRAWLIASVAVMALGVAACESAVSDGQPETKLQENDWVAETIASTPVIQAGRVTLSFGEGRVSGRSGCNLYSGPVEIGASTLKVGALISTKMACLATGVMQQESAYLNALEAAQTYTIAGPTLTITTAAGPIVYTATARQAQPEN